MTGDSRDAGLRRAEVELNPGTIEMSALAINGNELTLEAVAAVAEERSSVSLAPQARGGVERARAVVDALVAGNKVSYAITTGVGKLSDVRIAADQIRELQVNLLRSHAVGLGEPLSRTETRALVLLRANSLAKGHSGVRPLLIDTLCALLNRGVVPFVPSQGSVGASGDLAPLAHLALVLIGEGECVDSGGKRIPAAQALQAAGIGPLTLEAKEAISLINGTQGMLAVGILALLAAETLVDTADVVGALTLDALRGTDVAFDPRIHQVRPHAGQSKSAENLRRMLEGSELRESHRDCGRVQDAYSLRCMPQVHGAVRDALAQTRTTMEIETGSATDNPLVFAEGEILSGGNFHGAPLAMALDTSAIALTTLMGIGERRIDRLVNPDINEGLPPFLSRTPGVSSGFMIAHIVAAALLNEAKVLAHPASADSVPTSGGKEDHVSMGMTAALKFRQIVDNAERLLAIELLCAAQALEYRLPLKPARRIERAFSTIRQIVRPLDEDRVLSNDIESLATALRDARFDEWRN